LTRRALRIALAVGPDLRAYASLTDKRVVIRHLAVRVDPHDLALQLVEVLSSRTVIVLAKGDEQIAVAVKHQARTKVVADRKLGFLAEDHVEILDGGEVVRETPTPDRRPGPVALTATFGI